MSCTETLKKGLANLGATFNAAVCTVCDGAGEYEQMYTIGCGMGSYKSMGTCDWCGGQGLQQGGEAASAIVNQVMNAGRK